AVRQARAAGEGETEAPAEAGAELGEEEAVDHRELRAVKARRSAVAQPPGVRLAGRLDGAAEDLLPPLGPPLNLFEQGVEEDLPTRRVGAPDVGLDREEVADSRRSGRGVGDRRAAQLAEVVKRPFGGESDRPGGERDVAPADRQGGGEG